jgi:protein-S-isoprenylcysteine O-methyltransferase Ste14
LNLLLIVSLIWFISEVSLSLLKRSSTGSKNLDRSSLRILWITIFISINTGVFLAMSGIGRLNFYARETYFIGLFFVLTGLLLRWIAIFQLRKYFTVNVSIREDHQLIQKGLYRYLRHPSYSGSLLSFLGLALVFNNWLTFLIIFLPILFAFLYRISVEEAELQKSFGKNYLAYAQGTKKLIPGIY